MVSAKQDPPEVSSTMQSPLEPHPWLDLDPAAQTAACLAAEQLADLPFSTLKSRHHQGNPGSCELLNPATHFHTQHRGGRALLRQASKSVPHVRSRSERTRRHSREREPRKCGHRYRQRNDRPEYRVGLPPPRAATRRCRRQSPELFVDADWDHSSPRLPCRNCRRELTSPRV